MNTRSSDKSYPLYEGVHLGDLALARKLVNEGADVNYRFSPPEYDSESCLEAAISNGNYDMVEFLLENGADPHLTDSSGETALFHAVSEGNLRVIECLITHGADINMTSGMGSNTAIMDVLRIHEDTAVIHSLIRLLLRHGADPYKKNGAGKNLFAYAKGWKPLPRELVEKEQDNTFQAVGRSIMKRLRSILK